MNATTAGSTPESSRQRVEEILATAGGSEHLHRASLGSLRSTDGVVLIAAAAGAFWLIDAIASYQAKLQRRPDWEDIDRLAIWRLDVFNLPTDTPPSERWLQGYQRRFNRQFDGEIGHAAALLTMRIDKNAPVLVEQWILYTDFPCLEIELWTSDGVLMCPREY